MELRMLEQLALGYTDDNLNFEFSIFLSLQEREWQCLLPKGIVNIKWDKDCNALTCVFNKY